jgi:predicted membrane metal-binding protein
MEKSPPLYDGPDRRRGVQDHFETAVEIAASRAAQRVARMHRMRLVRWTFLAALLTALATVLILWFAWLKPQENSFSKANAIYDCRLFKENADTMADFVATDATLRAREASLAKRQQVITKENQIFGKTLFGKLLKIEATVNQNAISHWRNYDIPRLRGNSSLNCVKKLGG